MSSLRQNDLQSSEAMAGLSPLTRFSIERTALLVAVKGSEFEKVIMAKSVGNPDFSFLWSSDPNHELYQQTISDAQHNQDGECEGDAVRRLSDPPPKAPEVTDEGLTCKDDPRRLDDWINCNDRTPTPPTKNILTLPRGITRKEIYTITALSSSN